MSKKVSRYLLAFLAAMSARHSFAEEAEAQAACAVMKTIDLPTGYDS